MRHTIETAPRDGKFIIIEDDAGGRYDVAHWSPSGEWVREDGEPSKITPSRWYPVPSEKYLLQEEQLFHLDPRLLGIAPGTVQASSNPSRAGPSASRARRYSFFPFSLRRAAPQRPTTSDVVAPRSVALAAPVTVAAAEAQTAPVEPKRTPHALLGFATFSIAAALVAAAVTQYTGLQDIFRVSTIGGQVVEQETQLPSQDSRNTDLLALQQQAEADQASAQAAAQEAAQVKQAVKASVPEAQESLEKEQRAEALANELAEARRTIDGLNLQLRTEAAKTAQLLGQEREKTGALVQEATAARQELAASAGTVEEERARGVALARELATARRTLETQAALLNKGRDDEAQFKQTAERTTAELQQERDRAEASSRELAIARREIEKNVALNKARDYAAQFEQTGEKTTAELQQERDRADASSRELEIARREIETNVALLKKARDDAAQFKQTAESTTAELQQARDSAKALSRELAMARESTQRAIDTRIPLERAANSQPAKVTKAAEAAAMEQPAGPEALGSPEATSLIARASALLGQGNIGAARIVLERAADTGSAQASFMLAETYDPNVLSAWGTFGTRGEATKARELYAKAHAGGIQEARDRFSALR